MIKPFSILQGDVGPSFPDNLTNHQIEASLKHQTQH